MKSEILHANPIRQTNTPELKTGLLALVTWAYKFMRYGIEEEDLDFIVVNLAQVLKSDYSGLNLNQVSEAVQNGVKGKYGEFKGLSAGTFTSFLSKYVEEKRNEAKALKPYEPKQIEYTPTPEEFEVIFQTNLKTSYEKFKRLGVIEDAGNRICKELGKRKLITVTNEEWVDLLHYVKKKKESELNDKLNKNSINKTSSISEFRRLKVELSDLVKGSKKQEIESEAMNILLAKYYQTLTI